MARTLLPLPSRSTAFLAIFLVAASFSFHEDASADIGAIHESLVSEFASFNTPGVIDGRVETIAVDGDMVYVGGTFTQIHNPFDEANVINQPYLFAYSKSTGQIIESFDPQVNNSVLALETTGDPEGGVFAGGIFGNLNGQFSRGRFAKIDVNGDRVSGFAARVDAAVTSMVRLNDTLYIGGNFGKIGSTPVERLAALDTTTGAVDPNLNLDFEGLITTSYIDATEAVQGVDDIDITSDGRVMVVIGNFTGINGHYRPRLAVLELEGQARVSSWNTDVFHVQCPARKYPVYVQGIDISPDNTHFITGSTGFRYVGDPACDSIARYEIDDLTNTNVQPTWVNFTGGDSVFEVVSTEHAVYAGGHFRWLNNDTSPDGRSAGPGSVERRGFAALDPLNGLTLLNWRADRNPRGVGVFSLISEEEGLYMGDDTDFINDSEHRKLKFLPITSNVIERPAIPSLPTTLITPSLDTLDGIDFDGSTLGSTRTLHGSGWYYARGGVFLLGKLFHADAFGRIWMSAYVDGSFQSPTLVNLHGLTDSLWNIDQMGGMFFDHKLGRIYYTVRGINRLYYRAFTPASPYFGNDRSIAAVQGDIPWASVSGMDVIDGHLYYGHTNGYLYKAEIQGTSVISGTSVAISGPAIDGKNWNNAMLAFLTDESTTNDGPDYEFISSGSDTNGRFQSFEYPMTAGEEAILRLQWDDPAADLALFVVDPNGSTVAYDNTGAGSPIWLNVTADIAGTYTAKVLIREGSTTYNLQVNPTENPPEPRADFEFSSSGSPTDGKWQVFKFDVNAGELVDAEVTWDDPTADVRVFLRDENNNSVDKDTDGMPATLSATAQNSGSWSVGVSIKSGVVNYEVLVNTN